MRTLSTPTKVDSHGAFQIPRKCDFNHGLLFALVSKWEGFSWGPSMSKRTLPLEVRRQLQAIATPVLKEKGTVLFQMGQPCRGAFLIRSGQVQLSLDSVSSLYPARTVGADSIVGLPATFSGKPYSLTAETKTKCHLEFIARQKLLRLLHQNPDAGFQILRLLSEEIFHIRKLVNNGDRSSCYSPRVA